MNSSILSFVKNQISDALIHQLASKVDMDSTKTNGFLSDFLPVILGKVADKYSNVQQSEKLISELAKLPYDLENLPIEDSLLSDGKKIGTDLFDKNTSEVIEKLSKGTALSEEKTTTLFSFGSLVSMLSLKKMVTEKNLDANGLASLFESEGNSILSSVIPALSSVVGVLGLGKLKGMIAEGADFEKDITDLTSNTTQTAKELASDTTKTAAKGAKKTGIFLTKILPAIVFFLLGVFLFSLIKKCSNKQESTTETAIEESVVQTEGELDSNGNYVIHVGQEKEYVLPNSRKLKVGENSFEARLIEFLSDKNATVDEDSSKGWMTLDRVYFDNGSSDLTIESNQQINNIVIIMNAFNRSKLKFGGYTDNDGSQEINQRLSAERAEKVKEMIFNAGIGSNRLSFEGYGPTHPICEANDTPECKAQNRRVDARVVAK